MTVARWVAFVCTVVALSFSLTLTGCSAILGDFSDSTPEAGAANDASGIQGGGDASGSVDGSQPQGDGNVGPGVDSSIDSPVGPGGDSGSDAGPCFNALNNTPCSLPEANAICINGACSINNCVNGYLNCDGIVSNGCEVNGGTDPSNCLTCGHACGEPNAAQACTGGSCSTLTCNPGYADCDNIQSNGCETNLNTTTNCGTCSYVCGSQNGTPSCTAEDAGAGCTYVCTPPYAHCPTSSDKNGCDIDTATDNNNCGTCGNACALGQTCSNGTCACNPSTCKDGCCDPDGGACVTASTSACGISGNACVGCATGQHCDGTSGACVCDPSSCSGCCSGNVCITAPANPDTQCGQGGLACSNCTTDSLACSSDMTTCVCTQTSCATGCCNGNVCVPVGGAQNTNQCGTGGNECGKCAAGQACSGGGCECGGGACNGCCGGGACVVQDGGTATCGANGGVCAACSANQECNAQGQCVCDANTCPNGCCTATVGGTCVTTELAAACGSGGALCQACTSGSQECAQQGSGGPYACTCDSNVCKNGCCTAAVNGTCVGYGAESPTQCGAAGALCGGCGQGTYCNGSGVCTCDGTKCGGCCTSPTGSCLASNVGSCGIKGAACGICTTGQSCNAAGQCQCDGSSCGQGCCTALIGGTCEGGAANGACGVGGAICSICAVGSGTACNGVSCVCNTTSGCAGCCSSATTCAAGTGFGACGVGGNTCEPCATGQHCGTTGATTGECLCDSTSCAGGCCTATDNGTCVNYANEQTTQCGYTGALCAGCPTGQGCNLLTGHCGCTSGTGGSCPTGCCDTSGNCQTSGPSTCGTLGAACQNCTQNGVSCVNNQCQQILSVTVSPSGGGSISATAGGITNCTSNCSSPYTYGTSITLTQTPSPGYTFAGWSGACVGIGGCTFPMNAAESVTATYTIQQFLVQVTTTGGGSGTVVSTPPGINCPSGGGGTCQASFNYGTALTLTATPGSESNFNTTGWTGNCGTFGTSTVCNLNVTSPQATTATFTLNQFALNVAATGTGSGTMTSNQPPNINCAASAGATSGACSSLYNYNESVTVTAAASTGSTATGWTGNTNCSASSATCTLPVVAVTNLTATFALKPETLTVTLAGNGAGTVSSSPPGIACGGGGACSAPFNYGSTVTLTASPSTGSTVSAWSAPGCAGLTCQVDMTAATNVTVTFTLIPETLSVTSAGGTVTSVPAGIACGTTCSAPYNYNTSVKLTAAPPPGYSFTGWTGGGCATFGTSPCTVIMTAPTSVTANYVVSSAVWDSAWSPNLDYSNGNLSVTSPLSGSYTTTRTNFPMTSGAWYWEVNVTAGVATANVGGLGILGTGFSVPTGDGYLGETPNSLGFGYGGATAFYTDWPGPETFPAGVATDSIAVNNTYMFALNVGTGQMWAGVNGAWFPPGGTTTVGSPAADTLPTFTALTSPVYPAIVFYENGQVANAFTADFGASPFKYLPPAGFNAGIFPKVFGQANIGCGNPEGGDANELWGAPVTLPAMTVTGFGQLNDVVPAGTTSVMALYAASTASPPVPGALILSTTSQPIGTGNSVVTTTPTAIPAGNYFIAGVTNNATTLCWQPTATGYYTFSLITYGSSLPNPYPSGYNSNAGTANFGFYVVGF